MEALLAEARIGRLRREGAHRHCSGHHPVWAGPEGRLHPGQAAGQELCRLDFHWIRLHYLYPEAVTDELIETIARQPKIVHYLDIPIQHCNDAILKAMRRRNTRAEIEALFAKLRKAMPDVVLRTS